MAGGTFILLECTRFWDTHSSGQRYKSLSLGLLFTRSSFFTLHFLHSSLQFPRDLAWTGIQAWRGRTGLFALIVGKSGKIMTGYDVLCYDLIDFLSSSSTSRTALQAFLLLLIGQDRSAGCFESRTAYSSFFPLSI